MAKVLVADDSLSVRVVVERCLGTKGIEVLSVGSGREAIERFERLDDDGDGVISTAELRSGRPRGFPAKQ